jgi:phage terminase small subunit
MKEPKTPSKLSRAQLTQALDSVPVSHILGKGVTRELTPKQKRFALEVAKGSSGAEAYRKAYNTKALPKTQGNQAHKLKARPDISAEIDAYRVALESETYRTPAALRALVVQTLASVLVDPEAKQAVKVQAAKAIGAMTDVSLFTHRVEQRIIRSSDDARAELMAQIRELANAEAVDVTAIDRDADSLMAELAAGDADSGEDETHRTPTPLEPEAESLAHIHTIPHEQSPSFSDPSDPTPSSQDDPPSPS